VRSIGSRYNGKVEEVWVVGRIEESKEYGHKMGWEGASSLDSS
jgi:hypothetical protein